MIRRVFLFLRTVMRISVNSSDPGYAVWRALKRRGLVVDVMVDGQAVKNCVTLDTKRRRAVVHDRDDHGYIQLNARRNAVRCRVLVGDITVSFRRHGQAAHA